MILNWLIGLISILLGFTGSNSLSESKENPEKGMHIYLMIGQSNMAGRAEINGKDLDTLKNVYLYTGVEGRKWEKAANPLNKYSTIRKKMSMQKLGPGYHFAKKMAKKSKKNQIGLVVNAKGGTKISQWKPGTDFYNDAIKRTKDAMKYGILKGILWHQGEGDAGRYNKYTPDIIELIQAFRKDFELPNLPFVVGQLSEDKAHRIKFNEMILELPSKIENVGVVTTIRTNTFDSTHFDAVSQRLMLCPGNEKIKIKTIQTLKYEPYQFIDFTYAYNRVCSSSE